MTIEERNYTMAIRLRDPVAVARERVIAALQQEGFGIMTEIDVAATMKKKLDVDFRPYSILGACNPSLAHRALLAEADLGALMPCNVIVYQNDEGGSTVAAIDPVVQFSKVQNPDIEPVALDVRARLRRALESLLAG